MQNKKEETKKQSERDTLEYRNRMKNTLLWVDNGNRLCAEHKKVYRFCITEYRKSIWNAEKLYRIQNCR